MLELQCTSLRKDSQMYKKRIEAVLQQMEEVALERDQVIKYSSLLFGQAVPACVCCCVNASCCPSAQALLTREQFHMQYSKSLVERDAYRKQIRELGERCDEMQLQLFQKESQLLATEAKLKRLQLELPTLVQLCSSQWDWEAEDGVRLCLFPGLCTCAAPAHQALNTCLSHHQNSFTPLPRKCWV